VQLGLEFSLDILLTSL